MGLLTVASADFVVILAATLVMSWVATFVVRGHAVRRGLLDNPNARSSHQAPTPRLGGIAIVTATMTGWSVLVWAGRVHPDVFWPAAAGTGIVAAVGFADDLYALSPPVKLLGQVVAAAAAILLVPIPAPDQFLVFAGLAGVWLLCYTNFFNFMDGSDGLAGGVAVAAALGYAMLSSDPGLAAMALVLAAGVLGFLYFNWPRASIFMGDGGSLFLGLGLSWLFAQGSASGSLRPECYLVLVPFVFDAGYTLAARAARAEPVWQAHRGHLYQRLIDRWGSHARIATLYIGWTASTALLAMLWPEVAAPWRPFVVGLALVPGVMLIALLKKRPGQARP